MPPKDAHPECEAAVHILDTRTSVLEVRTDHLEECMKSHGEKLDDIRGSMGEVKQHIAKQNGAMPRLERGLADLVSQLAEQDKAEKQELKEQVSVRQKAKWTAIGSIVAGAIVVLLQYVVPLFF